jgi:hypothetical protein
MGANLMNASRRTEVIRTSLRTSAAALREARPLPESHHFEEDP